MSFRKPCHMPFRKLIPPFTLTAFFEQHLSKFYEISGNVLGILEQLP